MRFKACELFDAHQPCGAQANMAKYLAAKASWEAAPAIDGVMVDIADESRLRDDTRRAMRFGFGAKLCIHLRQIAVVHASLAPSTEELAWARRVIAADERAGGAAVQLDGRMIDAPVVLQARHVLSRVRTSAREGRTIVA